MFRWDRQIVGKGMWQAFRIWWIQLSKSCDLAMAKAVCGLTPASWGLAAPCQGKLMKASRRAHHISIILKLCQNLPEQFLKILYKVALRKKQTCPFMPCPRSRSLLTRSTFYILSLTQITKISKVCRRRSPRGKSCQRTRRRPSTPFAPRPWIAPRGRFPSTSKLQWSSHPLGFLFFPIMACWIMFSLQLKKGLCNSYSLQGDALPRCQVKKGNKPYTDDLTQLRSNPEDFQSEEEAADSASEVRGGGGEGWERKNIEKMRICPVCN